MLQSLRRYFILFLITIKRIMGVQEKIGLSSVSQRPRLRSTKMAGDLSFAAKINEQ